MRSKEKPVIIVQARMGSTRLPGKSMMKIAGKPLIDWVIEGAGAVKNAKLLVVAIPDLSEDFPLVEHLEKLGVMIFRGAADDVLGRYHSAALEVGADPVIRVCGDNPLLAADYMDSMIEEHIAMEADITHNASEIPLGAVGEVISMRALAKMNIEAVKPHQREHVTPYAYENAIYAEKFKIHATKAPRRISGNFRMTLDEDDDLEMFEKLFRVMKNDGLAINFQNALGTLRAHPDIAAVNASVKQKN